MTILTSHPLGLASAAALLFGAGASGLASAQSPADARQGLAASANAVSIEQIGSGNRVRIDQGSGFGNTAVVSMTGDNNGQGRIDTRRGAITTRLVPQTGDENGLGPCPGNGSGPGNGAGCGLGDAKWRTVNNAAPIDVPGGLQSGRIVQDGDGNTAVVNIAGLGGQQGENDFHITQKGDDHTAVQLIRGKGNTAAVLQGAGSSDRRNKALQLQLGSDNFAYALQDGSRNEALQAQLGGASAEAALLGGSAPGAMTLGLLGSVAGDGNTMLLEQVGDDNEARLLQVGSGHQMALRQLGGAEITIVQKGGPKTIGVEQSAGSRGITIVQRGG